MTICLLTRAAKALALLAGVLCCFAAVPARAQFDVSPASSLDFALLLKMFGPNTNFSARAELRSLGKDQKEKVSTPLDFAMLDARVRVQIDTTQMKNTAIPAAASAAMAQFGLDRVVSLVRPDRKASYIIFPGMKAYINTPMTPADLAAYSAKGKVDRTLAAKETLDGHPCVKNKLVVTDDQGGKHEAIVWEASDLRNFPMQIQTQEKEDTVLLRFSRVQFVRPDAKLFELPDDFTEHKDEKSLMQDVAAQMMKQITK